MRLLRSFLLLTSFVVLLPSCEKIKSLLDQNKPAEAAAGAGGVAGATSEANHAGTGGSGGEAVQANATNKYALPFVWDSSSDEPLAKVRSYLKEVISDNGTYAARGAKYFKALSENQTPRATIVSCSDSQIHQRAWHATPENDDFVIRNLGNQIVTSEGSIEYGVLHLHTPLLLIIGHSGCDAIKAASGNIDKESQGVQAELKNMTLPKPETNLSEKLALNHSVLDNVHNQVEYAVRKFGELVQEGKLTVVGTVYDYRNDFSEGTGKLLIIDVNGNSEPKRMKAFTDAINGAKTDEHGHSADGHDEHGIDPERSAEAIGKTIQTVSQMLDREGAHE